jgi:PAS domain-containing protein
LVDVLDAWKGRLRAAEAVLDRPAGQVSEQVVRKTLVSLIDALRGAIDRLETAAHELTSLRDSANAVERRSELILRCLPIPSIRTSRAGEIVAVNPKAASLLKTSARYLIGKSLLLFLEDRDACVAMLRELRESETAERPITLRPKERAKRQALAYVARLDEDTLQWFLFPDSRDI